MISLVDEYFEWMYKIVCPKKVVGHLSYRRLCQALYDYDFSYIMPMDSNRYEDGIDLRYKFGFDENIPRPIIADAIDCKPCSVLEMMIALAIRCENLMEDIDIGDRTSKWFLGMIENLELSHMTDENFDRDYVRERIDILLNRDYERDGSGGLFTIKKHSRDMRRVDIWYQAMWYLNEYNKEQEG